MAFRRNSFQQDPSLVKIEMNIVNLVPDIFICRFDKCKIQYSDKCFDCSKDFCNLHISNHVCEFENEDDEIEIVEPSEKRKREDPKDVKDVQFKREDPKDVKDVQYYFEITGKGKTKTGLCCICLEKNINT